MMCRFTIHLIQSKNGQPVERADSVNSTLLSNLNTSSDGTSLAPDQSAIAMQEELFSFENQMENKLKGLGKAEVNELILQ